MAPNSGERLRHAETLTLLRSLLLEEWQDARVQLFGSAANDLCIGNNNGGWLPVTWNL